MIEQKSLYYDKLTHTFSVNSEQNFTKVFESHQREGWAKGLDIIKEGPYEIQIHTNFWPKSPNQEYIKVNIFINGIQLLPLSLACRKTIRQYYFSERIIAFQQWGSWNKCKQPYTIVQKATDIDWETILIQICNICNNYEDWIMHEVEQLKNLLTNYKKIHFWNIAEFIDLVRRYDDVAPNIVPIYREFIDSQCFNTMMELLKFFESHQKEEKKLNNATLKARTKDGDIIWNYIKSYFLSL